MMNSQYVLSESGVLYYGGMSVGGDTIDYENAVEMFNSGLTTPIVIKSLLDALEKYVSETFHLQVSTLLPRKRLWLESLTSNLTQIPTDIETFGAIV